MKTGDVVRLKSGGPAMTVDEADEATAACEWFTGDVVHERQFSVAMLEGVCWGGVIQAIKDKQDHCSTKEYFGHAGESRADAQVDILRELLGELLPGDIQ